MERAGVGGTRPGHARSKALDLLADGKWHDRRKVISQIAAAVPPGPALRQAKKRRKVEVDDSDPVMKEKLVRAGQRFAALDVLNDKERFERDGDKVRLRPYRQWTFEERSAHSLKAAARSTPEQRSEQAHRSAATRKARRQAAAEKETHPGSG